MIKKIGFFAGTFDPVHDGHVASAIFAVKELDLDELYFMVEKEPWTDKKPIDIIHRKAMVDLVIQNYSKLEQLEIEDERFKIATTLQIIEEQFKNDELYFIFGADVFLQINSDKWPGLEKLLKHNIAVIERGKITQKQINEHAITLGIIIATLSSKHPHHSSTDIRLRPHEKELWIDESVSDYIQINNLY